VKKGKGSPTTGTRCVETIPRLISAWTANSVANPPAMIAPRDEGAE